jgi:hypothetical protein
MGMSEFMDDIVTIISNGLAIPTLAACMFVVGMWAKSAWQAVRSPWVLSHTGWFVLGVFLGFGGEVLDNIYWFMVWVMVSLDYESASYWTTKGVYFNIPFRQVLAFAAAYCHIRSAIGYLNDEKSLAKVHNALKLSFFVGLGLIVYLLKAKGLI